MQSDDIKYTDKTAILSNFWAGKIHSEDDS